MIIPVKVKTITPLHLGSGKADVLIDAEVVHDEYGLPYLPAKRFKGVLFESALEVVEMFEECNSKIVTRAELIAIFGRDEADSNLAIHDLHVANYEEIAKAWKYLQNKYSKVINANDVLAEYSEVRYQTKIDRETGTAADKSLHNMRVVDKGITFVGEIELFHDNEKENLLLALALKNLQYIGAKRNRGFGKILCELTKDQKELIERSLN